MFAVITYNVEEPQDLETMFVLEHFIDAGNCAIFGLFGSREDATAFILEVGNSRDPDCIYVVYRIIPGELFLPLVDSESESLKPRVYAYNADATLFEVPEENVTNLIGWSGDVSGDEDDSEVDLDESLSESL